MAKRRSAPPPGRSRRATLGSARALALSALTIPEVVRAAAAVAPLVATAAAAGAALAPMGPLLRQAMAGLHAGGVPTGLARFAMDTAAPNTTEPVLPLAMSVPRIEPAPGERWPHYKERVLNALGPVREWLKANAGLDSLELISGNALGARALTGQVREAVRHQGLKLVELDPPYIVTTMDDAVADIELPMFQAHHPGLDGTGIRVAVLDSGIDTLHPWLKVSDSVSTCGESVNIPGRHGTHVAGSIASLDAVYRGVAPGVTLLNIKVLTALGSGQATFITAGVDAALDRNAQILSMSLGFNHLPTWSQGGHGWSCSDGMCQLCTAVNNAVSLEGVIAVVAAGNEHERATFLRDNGSGQAFDSEISCPGAASAAVTVAALTKQTFLTAPFSSRGPTAFGSAKPDIAAPGVNITSAIPASRGANGKVLPNLTRAELGDRLSGTSMATPIVSGVVALILQRRLQAGEDVSASSVRHELLSGSFRHLAKPPAEVGVGRLNVGSL